jgi:ribonucleoside-diphosphate reductase alpha chain
MTGFSRFGVVPETLLLTSKGYEPIGSLDGQEVDIWNGDSFEQATVVKIATDQRIVRVTTKNLLELECSENQQFITQPGLMPVNLEIKEATELEEETKIPRIPLCPVTTGGDKTFPHAYSHGFYSGMERYQRSRLKVSRAAIYGVRHPILEHLDLNQEETTKTSLMFTSTIPEDFDIPLDPSYSIKTKLDWLAGLADGGLYKRKIKPIPIWMFYSDNVDFLYQIKLLLQTLGVDSTHIKNKDAVSKHYSLTIRGKALEVLRDQGLPTRVAKFEDVHIKKNGPNGTKPPRILLVEDAYRTSNVYNFVHTERKTAVCNGLLIATN